jgi:hypothetical protein
VCTRLNIQPRETLNRDSILREQGPFGLTKTAVAR